MIRRQRDIDTQNHEVEKLAERLELRLHAIALILTAVVLAMRLVAGRQDLTSEACCASGDEQSSGADTLNEPASAAYVGVP